MAGWILRRCSAGTAVRAGPLASWHDRDPRPYHRVVPRLVAESGSPPATPPTALPANGGTGSGSFDSGPNVRTKVMVNAFRAGFCRSVGGVNTERMTLRVGVDDAFRTHVRQPRGTESGHELLRKR